MRKDAGDRLKNGAMKTAGRDPLPENTFATVRNFSKINETLCLNMSFYGMIRYA